MKLAVLSDIHANFQALETVMEDIKKEKCERVLCLGDIAMAGPQPRIVIDYIRNQNNWIIIQGNTDNMIGNFCPEIFNNVKKVFPIMANALADDILIIEDDKKNYLANLPPQKSIEIEGVKILMVHGSPRRNDENIMPNMLLTDVEEIIKGTTEDLILCGHTHIPAGYQTSTKQTVVNVGSVGRPMTPDAKACYVILNIENGGFEIEHRFLDYDREMAASILKLREFEGNKELSEILLNPTKRHL